MKNRGIEPKEIELKGGATGRLFTIYKMPAIAAKRILTMYKEKMSIAEQEEALLATLCYASYDGKPLDGWPAINAAIDSLQDLQELEFACIEYSTAFFKKRKQLRFLEAMNDGQKWQSLSNVDEFIGAIIRENKATMKELREDYTLEEAFDIWEVIATDCYNQWLAQKRAEMRNKIIRK